MPFALATTKSFFAKQRNTAMERRRRATSSGGSSDDLLPIGLPTGGVDDPSLNTPHVFCLWTATFMAIAGPDDDDDDQNNGLTRWGGGGGGKKRWGRGVVGWNSSPHSCTSSSSAKTCGRAGRGALRYV